MRPSHLSLLTAALLTVAASHASAQLPLPTDLPWNSPPRSVRFALVRLGLRESAGATAAGLDSTLVFTAPVSGASARLTTRFRAGHLWHAFLTVQGDSAA